MVFTTVALAYYLEIDIATPCEMTSACIDNYLAVPHITKLAIKNDYGSARKI